MLRALGAQPVVLAVTDAAHEQDRWRLGDADIRLAAARGPAQLAYAPDLPVVLSDAKLDLLHLLGVWQYPTHAAGRWADETGRPLIISPHGMFDPWITGRNAWKKQAARLLWERRAWHRAAAFHALTAAEAADIERESPGARVAVVPNAAPAASPPRDRTPPPHLLYLGRIHEKKNIAALIAAWRSLRGELPADATLTIAGWGDDEGIAMLEHAMERADPSIQFVGTAFGAQKAALFDVSRFLVLPSLSEGLPMAILEAWASGTPTIQSDACNLPEGFATGAAIRCGTDRDAIADAIRTAMSIDDAQWLTKSAAARELAASPFSQASIALHWEEIYGALL
ncbi:glycosyltransferase [Qipengyuania flava]|uniref:glycosyltransferase n=1 Tax=Qipengyuania flava TaxID=192812 RepID=UPI001C631DBB|nr:glycosyltransferase [Qipengyuania flava]QYJ06690.1 glycosyltransferase [Qipengyuania flava]